MSRRENDAYYTPDSLASALVSVLPIGKGVRVWEPHAGGGAFVRALLAAGAEVAATDIDPTAPVIKAMALPDVSTDFLTERREVWGRTRGGAWESRGPDWIVGNPPFRGFEEHVEHALTCAPNVAFLLRLASMESTSRVDAWRRWPLRRVWVLAERPSFTDGGTDSAAYGFFWWNRYYTGPAEIVPGWSWKVRA